MEVHVDRRSNNVFADIGFPPEEAAHLVIRADLMLMIERTIKAKGLSQKEAAKLLHVTQPRISDLVCGRIDRFGIDTLVEMLTRLGAEVTLKVRKPARVA